MRLFSALIPPPDVRDDLAPALAHVSPEETSLRWVPRERWHLTLGFFGDDDDPETRSDWLSGRVSGMPSPRLYLAGGGTFPGVLWVGVRPVEPRDETALRELAEAAGTGQRFHPHLTIARVRRRAPTGPVRAAVAELRDYRGPAWCPTEVVLVRSQQHSGGHHYTQLTHVPLRPAG